MTHVGRRRTRRGPLAHLSAGNLTVNGNPALDPVDLLFNVCRAGAAASRISTDIAKQHRSHNIIRSRADVCSWQSWGPPTSRDLISTYSTGFGRTWSLV